MADGVDRPDPLVRVRDLRKSFELRSPLLRRRVGAVEVVRGVSFDVGQGSTLGLVGESGCGKSTVARCITRLLDVTEGAIELDGTDITDVDGEHLRRVRRQVQIVFQDPREALNPFFSAGTIVGEPLVVHRVGTRQGRERVVGEMLDHVGLGRSAYRRRPHEFSGGERQRLLIARALVLEPQLLILDEAVSALDVSIQAQILNLLEDLQDEFSLSYVFISHDLDVIQYFCEDVVVMYLGKVMEIAPAKQLFEGAAHPYTLRLQESSGVLGRGRDADATATRRPAGDQPSVMDPPSGCPFRTRCDYAEDVCAESMPPLVPLGPNHLVACHFPRVDGVAAPSLERTHTTGGI